MLYRILFILMLWMLYLTECIIREENEVLACSDEAIHLSCQDKDSILVIYKAAFATDGSIVADHCVVGPDSNNETCYDDVRLLVNSKCSGFHSCKFLVSELVPRECYGKGVLSLVYGCVPDNQMIRFCNVNITGNTAEGFIHNPGYPNYYPDLGKCTWTISANAGQRVLLQLLDMSMRRTFGSPVDCSDVLLLYDGNVKLMHACGQSTHLLHTMQSKTNTVRIIFQSRDVWPSRGVLFYYRVLGCPTLIPPEHGYLVYRNDSMAHYMCCARHVFVDDYRRNRFLYCFNGNQWNGTLNPCKHVKMLRKWQNTTGVKFEDDGLAEADPIQRVPVESQVSYLLDIMIPSIIMAVLITVNVIIVVIILRLRRKKADAESRNGNHHIKSDYEPQPSTSKQDGLDREELVTNV